MSASTLLGDKKVRAGIIGIVLAVAMVLAFLQFSRLPFLNGRVAYTANFADAGGLMSGDDVEVAGVKVGRVESIALSGAHVRVKFSLPPGIRLGGQTKAAIKTTTLLGRKMLAVTPTGSGTWNRHDDIPLSRTTSPYSLNDALGDLSTTVRDLDTGQLNTALDTLSDALANTPAPLRATLDGVAGLSRSINSRDQALRDLLTKAQSVTKVLAGRDKQVNALMVDGNQLLGELEARRSAISQLIVNIGAVSRQLTGLVQDNQKQLQPALTQVNQVLALLEKNKTNVAQALDGLVGYTTSLSDQVGAGPWFNAFLAAADQPGIQALVDALVRPDHLPDDLHAYLTPFPKIGPAIDDVTKPGGPR